LLKDTTNEFGGLSEHYSPHPPIVPKKKRENALSLHLRGLFAAVGVSNDF